MRVYQNAVSAQLEPKLVRVEKNLFILRFEVMKLLPAFNIIKNYIRASDSFKRPTIIDSSSGSFAFGIAMACRHFGVPFEVVTDQTMDLMLRNQLQSFPGKLFIINKPVHLGGSQLERLAKVKELLAEKASFWTNQYDNRDNFLSYIPYGRRIGKVFGENIHLVGPVGSGGSTGGLITGIRQIVADAELTGVDTFGSALFGLKAGPRELMGLGGTIIPKNICHQLYDHVQWLSARAAYHFTRNLHRAHGFFCGPTTGVAYAAAKFIAGKNRKKNVIFVSPDQGYRYYKTVYAHDWVEQRKLELYPDEPTRISSLDSVAGEWCQYEWNRKSRFNQ